MFDEHPVVVIESFVLVAMGGFLGANVRYLVGTLAQPLVATLSVNALGSCALGFVLFERVYVGEFSEPTRVALGTGFLSSLTTYSTFAVQTVTHPTWAVANVVGNYALGLLGVLVGRELATRVGR